jgi:hypothetical protein
VKYWKGLVAPHSCPMKSSGVMGTVRRTVLAARQTALSTM